MIKAAPRKSKYRNVPVKNADGVRFASKAEAKRDGELRMLERAGAIHDLKRQPKFDLIVNGKKVCRYIGDWEYVIGNVNGGTVVRVVEDRKGAITPAFRIKWALARALHPEIEWRLS